MTGGKEDGEDAALTAGDRGVTIRPIDVDKERRVYG